VPFPFSAKKSLHDWREKHWAVDWPKHFSTPPLAAKSARSRRDRFGSMMHCAKALTVSDIEWLATIFELNDMIGDHPVFGPSVGAPEPTLDRLTSIVGTVHHLLTPGPEFGGVVERVLVLAWQACGADVDRANERRQHV